MLLRILQDTRAPGRCRSCGAAIVWAELTTGKRMPFNRIDVLRTQSGLLEGRVVEDVDTTTSPVHFQTCPEAKDWRRRR
jgi:hypothetical protein